MTFSVAEGDMGLCFFMTAEGDMGLCFFMTFSVAKSMQLLEVVVIGGRGGGERRFCWWHHASGCHGCTVAHELLSMWCVQARATQPQRQLSPNALLLRQQQKEIARQRQELQRLQKLLAQRQQPQIQPQPQPQPPQPQQQTAVNVPASNLNSVGVDVNAVGTGGTQTGSQTGTVQSNSVNAEAGPSPAGGVPGSDNLIVSGTGTGKGAADTGVKPSVLAPAAGVANTGTTAATPVNK